MTTRTDNYQIGLDADPNKNFTLRVPAVPDGSLILSRGNASAPGATILTVNPQGAIMLPDGTYVGGSGWRNRVDNANMRINQRNAGATTTDYQFIVDRWTSSLSGSLSATFGIGGVNISLTGGQCIFVQSTAQKAALSASDVAGLMQRIEGYNVADLLLGTANAKPFTVSFRANAPSATTIGLAVRNGASNRSYVANVALNSGVGNYAVTIPGDLSGTWATDNTLGLALSFVAAAGSNWQAPANTWVTGNFLGTAQTSNIFDTVSRYVTIADVQLEPGTTASQFDGRNYSDELRRCQRYFQRLPNNYALFNGNVTSGTTYYVQAPFLVPMRVAPSASNVTSSGAGNMTIGTALVLASSVQFSMNATATANSATCYAGCDLSAEL